MKNYVELFQDPDFPKSVILTIVFLLASAVVGQNVLGLASPCSCAPRTRSSVRSSAPSSSRPGSCPRSSLVRRVRLLQRRGHAQRVPEVDRDQRAELAVHVPDARRHPGEHLARHRLLDARLLGCRAGGPRGDHRVRRGRRCDGWQRLVYITLPVIRRSISTNSCSRRCRPWSVFTLIFVMTGGGPGTNSSTLPILAYQEAFSSRSSARDRDRDHPARGGGGLLHHLHQGTEAGGGLMAITAPSSTRRRPDP